MSALSDTHTDQKDIDWAKTVDWYTTVVFKGSGDAERTCYVIIPKANSIKRFAELALDKFKIKDVLADVEFTRWDENNKETKTIVDPDSNFWDAVQAYGTTATVYTDAELPRPVTITLNYLYSN